MYSFKSALNRASELDRIRDYHQLARGRGASSHKQLIIADSAYSKIRAGLTGFVFLVDNLLTVSWCRRSRTVGF